MSHVLHRELNETPALAVGGEGIHMIDAAGRRYIDASGGAAVSCLGHGHPAVIEALVAQARRLPFAYSGFFTTEVAEELADTLIEGLPEGFGRVLFVGSGSEAMEAALKLARQYHVERGEPQRTRFISRRQSYHGNTLGALSAGGNMARRALYAPMLLDVSLIDPCFAYRHRRDHESEEAYGERVAGALEAEILRLGPETVCAFLAETVVGATTGAVPPVPGYFARIREICDRYGVLLILDEVMCGMGRTGPLFAFEAEGIVPDLIAVAKGLGGGYGPLGGLIASNRVVGAIEAGSGLLMHGHTYLAHPMACAAGLAVQRVIREERLLDNVRAMGERLTGALTERFGNHAHVGDIRGRGLLQAIELVADRSTKAPFDPGLALHARIKEEAWARELIVYPMGGTVDGRVGDHVIVAPPYIVDATAVDEIVGRLGEAVDAALGSVGR